MSRPDPKKTAIGCGYGLVQILILTPIWYYLMYRLLVVANADTAMWVCFWVYVPIGILAGIAKAIWEAM